MHCKVEGTGPVLGEIAFQWLEREGANRLIIRDDLTIVWRSSVLHAFVERSALLALSADRLVPASAIEARFRAFVAAAGQSRDCMVIAGFAEGVDALVWAFRAGTGEGDVVCLDFGLDRDREDLCQHVVRRRFQLTPAELRVLARMLAGQRPTAIASDSEVSIETVRSHIRSIYAKTRVRSREELFGLMNRYRFR